MSSSPENRENKNPKEFKIILSTEREKNFMAGSLMRYLSEKTGDEVEGYLDKEQKESNKTLRVILKELATDLGLDKEIPPGVWASIGILDFGIEYRWLINSKKIPSIYEEARFYQRFNFFYNMGPKEREPEINKIEKGNLGELKIKIFTMDGKRALISAIKNGEDYLRDNVFKEDCPLTYEETEEGKFSGEILENLKINLMEEQF